MFCCGNSFYRYMNNPFMGGCFCNPVNHFFSSMMKFSILSNIINNMFARPAWQMYTPQLSPYFMMAQAYPMPQVSSRSSMQSVFSYKPQNFTTELDNFQQSLYRDFVNLTRSNTSSESKEDLSEKIQAKTQEVSQSDKLSDKPVQSNKSKNLNNTVSKEQKNNTKTLKVKTSTSKVDMKKYTQFLMNKYKTYYSKKGVTEEQIYNVVKLACETAKKYGVDERLVLAVIEKESNFVNKRTSSKGAQGLMQLMPTTAKGLGVTNPMDPAQNIDGGVKLLKKLLDKFDGDVKKALASYNAGEGHVRDFLNGTNKHGKNPQHKVIASGIPPFKETQNYVNNIYNNYKNSSVA